MKIKVVIYGASGHGKVVKDVIEREDKYELLGFIDDDPDLKTDDNACSPIIGNLRFLKQSNIETSKLILAIGKNRGREELYSKIKELKAGFDYIIAIHPSAEIAEGVKIGRDSMVGAGAAVIDNIPDGVTAVGVPAKVKDDHREDN